MVAVWVSIAPYYVIACLDCKDIESVREKPRFVILGFQTNRKGQTASNASRLDHCNISNVKLFLNSQYYPYGNLNLNINQNQYALLYNMYASFQKMYYEKEIEPLLKKGEYIQHAPLVIIDCSKQNESL